MKTGSEKRRQFLDRLRAIETRIARVTELSVSPASLDRELNECTAPVIEEKIRSLNPPRRIHTRLSGLEDEAKQQRAALDELRECSVQTERTMEKLLKGIDAPLAGGNAQHRSR